MPSLPNHAATRSKAQRAAAIRLAKIILASRASATNTQAAHRLAQTISSLKTCFPPLPGSKRTPAARKSRNAAKTNTPSWRLTFTPPTQAQNAAGRPTVQQKTLNVKIPKGIAEGQQIRLAGQGLAGYNGGANGDLYLKIRFHARPDLYVKNRKDVYQTINVMPWQAVLGGKITVATASGRLQVTLPANSHNGKTIRLKGQGIPAKEAGDLYLVIHIAVPEANSEADRALWQQLADHYAQSAH